LDPSAFLVKSELDKVKAHVILVKDGHSYTKHLQEVVPVVGGIVTPDLDKDILRVSVVERHGKTGNVANGLVKGFCLKRGAIATTVSHDAHNLILVGIEAYDMYTAVNAIKEMGGGIAVVDNGRVVARVALPIAGLMSMKPLYSLFKEVEEVKEALNKLGCRLRSPFMALSFLSLAVIPEIRITDKGLVDVLNFSFIPLLIGEN
jgi:adenine deaminase